MSAEREWSRSRFWLCHFLHNRHVRPRIDWSAAGALAPPLAGAAARWLGLALAGESLGAARFVRHTVRAYGDDPAFVQSARLLAKEREFHRALIRRLAGHLGLSISRHGAIVPVPAAAVACLGPRFELSVLLLSNLVEEAAVQLVHGRVHDAGAPPSVRGACELIGADLRAHRAFYTERLTMEFADFNFARRNLRRARLRGMFAATLAATVARDGALIDALGPGRSRFVRGCWASFSAVLERMVPYRRDALMAALLSQREHPYDKPRRV